MKKFLTANLYDVNLMDLLYFHIRSRTGYSEISEDLIITCEDLTVWLKEHNIKVYYNRFDDLRGEIHHGIVIFIPDDRKDLLLYYKLRWE